MLYWKYATLILLFHFYTLPAQNYLWPTDASKNITSSFGEFRPRHFHAALDIKTWAQTGYKIFAIEDGFIYRIRVSSNGYGKAIYLKLKDGNIVIYAHLNAFIPKLESYTDSLRLAAKNNTLDAFPKSSLFPVKKGDLLGFTGETGIGVPHLHFEIRDPKNFPINPWQFYKNEIADVLPPLSRSLAVIPLSATTLIDFKPDTLLLDLQPRQIMKITEPIHLTGNAYIAVKSFDQANGADNLFSFYKASLFINNLLQYEVKYDRFSYAETRLVELDKNFSLWRRGMGVFHNLYRHPFNGLSFYEDSKRGSGVLSKNNLNEGLNDIRIELNDFDGNHSEIEFQVLYHKKNQLKVFDLSKVSNTALVGLKATVLIKRMEVKYGNSDFTRIITATGHQLKLLNNFMNNYFYSLSLPVQPGYDMVEIKSFDEKEVPLIPIYFSLTESSPDSSINTPEILEMRFFGSQIGIKTKSPIHASDRQNMSPIFEFQPDAHRNYTVFDSDAFQKNSGNAIPRIHDWVQIIPGRKTAVFSSDSNIRLDFFEDAAYDTFFCNISMEESPGSFAVDYPILTPIYTVAPFDQVLNRGAMLSFTIPESIRNQQGLGIYYWDARKGWRFLPSNYFGENRTMRSRVTSLEKFVIIKDTIPPEIIPYGQARSGSLYLKKYPLRIGVQDKMSGIYDQDQIEVFVDNNWTLYQYDPEENLVIIPPKYVPAGQHRLMLKASDNVGNQSIGEFEIIKR